jgi:hypothetical protein
LPVSSVIPERSFCYRPFLNAQFDLTPIDVSFSGVAYDHYAIRVSSDLANHLKRGWRAKVKRFNHG